MKKTSPALFNFYAHAALEAIEKEPGPFAAKNLASSKGVSINVTGIFGTYGNDVIIGDGSGKPIYGREGNDLLVGNQSTFLSEGEGADVMMGGSIDNTYAVHNPTDRVIEFDNGGHDQVIAASSDIDLTYILPAHVEDGVAQGFRATVSLIGNELDNMMIAGATRGSARVFDMEGNDHLKAIGYIAGSSLDGGAGNDILETYGTSQTVMTGGQGQDRFVISTQANSFHNELQITDFNDQDDRILLSQAWVKADTGGAVSPDSSGAQLAEAGFLVFNRATSELQWHSSPQTDDPQDVQTLAALTGVTSFDFGDFFLV